MDHSCLWIFLCSVITITAIEAQYFSKLSKEKFVIDLNKRPLTTTMRPPHERRKLGIFPKSAVKFVVTSKPYTKVRNFSPWDVSTKKPLIQKISTKSLSELKDYLSVTKSTTRLMEQNQIDLKGSIKTEEFVYGEKPYHVLHTSNDDSNARTNNLVSDYKKMYLHENTDKVNGALTNSVNKGNRVDLAALIAKSEAEELLKSKKNRSKRLSLRGYSGFNDIDVSSHQESYSSEELSDANEFIFINNNENLEPVESVNNVKESSEDSVEFATEFVMLEEYTTKEPRQERSVNIIEEEYLATTMSDFKYTGRDTRLHSDLVFRNINA